MNTCMTIWTTTVLDLSLSWFADNREAVKSLLERNPIIKLPSGARILTVRDVVTVVVSDFGQTPDDMQRDAIFYLLGMVAQQTSHLPTPAHAFDGGDSAIPEDPEDPNSDIDPIHR